MSELEGLLAPRGVAVIGASRQGDKLGAVMARALSRFPGGCALINNRHPDPAGGVHATTRDAVDSSSGPIDLVALCVPAAACASALDEAATSGVRAAVVCAGGFSETGEEGAALERDLLAVAKRHGVRLLGPNTSGYFLPGRGLTASFVPGAEGIKTGDIAVVAASGGVNHALSFELSNSDNGLSMGIGIGAGLDVTAAEVLEHLVDDPGTRAVALHVETIPDGPRLLRAVAALTAVKPVVALVVGEAEATDFAQSHTGALATSWRTARAALRQAGAVLVSDERAMVDALEALSRSRLRPALHPGVGLVTAQAGPGLLLADELARAAIRLPELQNRTREKLSTLLQPMTYQRNPVDTGRPGPTFPGVLQAVAGDPGIDLLLAYALLEPGSIDPVAAVEFADLPDEVPVVMGVNGPAEDVILVRAQLHKAGVPVLTTPAAMGAATRAMVQDAQARAVASETDVDVPTLDLAIPGGGTFDEDQAKTLLDTLGITTPHRRTSGNLAEALTGFDALEKPVVAKLLDASVKHKTEIGGVHLGITDTEGLTRAYEALSRAGATRVLLESMAPDGIDLIVAARRDPVFGPVVLLGMGGTNAELVPDVTLRCLPASSAQLRTMVGDLAGSPLLEGHRGSQAVDPTQLVRVLQLLGAAVQQTPSLAEIEINPLRLTAGGLVALDAVVTTREP